MRNWNIELDETILSDESGMPLVKMMTPKGWTVSAYRKELYRGYNYPRTIQVLMRSPDQTCRLYYCSPIQGFDNHLEAYRDYTIDSMGNLNCRFRDFETQNQERAERYISSIEGASDLSFIRQIEYNSNKERRRTRGEEEARRFETSELNILSDYYYKGGIRKYQFRQSSSDHFYACAMTVEGATCESWHYLPPAIVQGLQDPFMAEQMKNRFPHAQFNENVQRWIFLSSFYTWWTAKNLLELDCLLEDQQELYQKLFVPVNRYGAVFTDELRAELERIKTQGDRARAKKREEEKATGRVHLAEQEAKRQRRQQQREKLYQTQKQISDIRRAAYENQRKSQAKTREIWSDTLRGDTRFVDRQGNEHVLHTYDRYAYKSGDTYVTSDSRLDHDWDWEELEKKKY